MVVKQSSRIIIKEPRKEGETLKIPALTKSEETLMMFLWNRGKPLSVQEMIDSWGGYERTWKDNHMRVIVRALVEKGALEIAELDYHNSRASRRLRPTFSKKEYYAQVMKRGGLTASEMVEAEAVALAQKGDKEGMSALIRDLKGIIEEYAMRDDAE